MTFHFTLAQSTISGRVVETNNESLPFANVLLLNPADSSLIKGVVTTSDGNFSLSYLQSGTYLIYVKMVGYSPYLSSHFKLNAQEDKVWETIIMEQEIQALKEVVIVAQKPLFEQQIDRLVINVQNSITAAGGTVLEVLERSPGVGINRQTGTMSVNGKEGVAVMVNGKLQRLSATALVEMLQGMNSSMVDKIELITHPSARHDAEGAGGMINIVTKENNEYGTNGSFSITGGYGYGEKAGGSFAMNYRNKKFNLFGDYSILHDRTHQYFEVERKIQKGGNESYTSTLSERFPIIHNNFAHMGFDYELTPRTMVGAQVGGYSTKWQMDAFNHTSTQNAENPIEWVQAKNEEINHWRHLMGNMNLSQTFQKGQDLHLDIDYLLYHDDNPESYVNDFINGMGGLLSHQEVNIRKKTPIHIIVAKVDYHQSLGNKIDWEVGLKGTTSRFTNDMLIEMSEEENTYQEENLSGLYRLQENIGAGYTSFQIHFTPNAQLQLGVRYEHTTTHLGSEKEKDMVQRRYGNLFPSLLFSQEINSDNSILWSYSRRITRPTFNDLAPFVIYLGPNTFMSGNVALQPAITDALKVQYKWKAMVLSMEYRHDKNAIAGFQPHINPETNEQLNYGENLKRLESYSFTVMFPWQITSWWETQYSLVGTRQQVVEDYQDRELRLTHHHVRISSTQSFKLPWNFNLELSGYFQSPFLLGIYWQKSIGTFNVGMQKKLKHVGGTLTLTINDIFWSTSWRWRYNIPEKGLQSALEYKLEPRIIKLTYTRNFGNRQIKVSRQRTTASEEEQKRVN